MSISEIRSQCEELARVIDADPNVTRPEHQHTRSIVEILNAMVRELDLLHDRFEKLRRRAG